MLRRVKIISTFLVLITFLFANQAFAEFDFEKYKKSVGRIVSYINVSDKYFPIGTGSGFVIDNKGHFATNAHNLYIPPPGLRIEGLSRTITKFDKFLVFFDENTFSEATVVKIDKTKDLAIVKLASCDRPPLKLSIGKRPKPGETLTVLGFPGVADMITSNDIFGQFMVSVANNEANSPQLPVGLMTPKLNNGPLSCEMDQSVESGGTRKVILMDVDINHGNSGGPVFDDCGRVVGVATFGFNTREGDSARFAVDVIELKSMIKSANIKAALVKKVCKKPLDRGTVVAILAAVISLLVAVIVALKKPQYVKEPLSRLSRRISSRRSNLPLPHSPHLPVSPSGPVAPPLVQPGPPTGNCLQFMSGQMASQIIPLGSKIISIGSQDSVCDVPVMGAAQKHMEAAMAQESIILRDVFSRQSIFLDGVPIEPGDWKEVFGGQVVRLGNNGPEFMVFGGRRR